MGDQVLLELVPLEAHLAWSARDMADPAIWTQTFSDADLAELEAAVEHSRVHKDLTAVRRSDFPLPRLASRLRSAAEDLQDGRGFVVWRGLPRERWSDDDLVRAYWGLGMHLGQPCTQDVDHDRRFLVDVRTDPLDRPDRLARGNEKGQIGLNYHCDGADLVGLLCLQSGAAGGLSLVCSSVAIHNRMVREEPELAAELYRNQPLDYRKPEGAPGRQWFSAPVFARSGDRLFVKLIQSYILSSQRHSDAPRLTPRARDALHWMQEVAESDEYSAIMSLEPGDIQFVNNYHVLHGRTPYRDDPATGQVRHLKRLWLDADLLQQRPEGFGKRSGPP